MGTRTKSVVFAGDDSAACFIAGILVGRGIQPSLEPRKVGATGRTVTAVLVEPDEAEEALRIRTSSSVASFGNVAAAKIAAELVAGVKDEGDLCPDAQDFETEEEYEEALDGWERRKKRNVFPIGVDGGPPNTPNREDLRRLARRVGIVEVVQAVADVARFEADEIEESWVERNLVPNDGAKRTRDLYRNAHFFCEDAAARLRRGFA